MNLAILLVNNHDSGILSGRWSPLRFLPFFRKRQMRCERACTWPNSSRSARGSRPEEGSSRPFLWAVYSSAERAAIIVAGSKQSQSNSMCTELFLPVQVLAVVSPHLRCALPQPLKKSESSGAGSAAPIVLCIPSFDSEGKCAETLNP